MSKLELEGDFVITEALFEKEDVPKYEELGIPEPENKSEDMELSPFRFRFSGISSYNPAEEGVTTVRINGKDSFRINIPFDVFDKFVRNRTIKKYREDKDNPYHIDYERQTKLEL